MGYCLKFVTVSDDVPIGTPILLPTKITTLDTDPTVHVDPFEGTGAGRPVRLVSYTTWSDAMRATPEAIAFWWQLHAEAGKVPPQGRDDLLPVIACAHPIWQDPLNRIERAVATLRDDDHGHKDRILWLCRWWRRAMELHGDRAGFTVPAEWSCG